jgi:hypothetical protein
MELLPSDVTQPGQGVIYVSNLSGGNSNTVMFDITAPGKNPLPSVSSISPSSVTSHGGASTPIVLTVNGANFITGSIVLWNGSPRPTTYVSATQLKADISGTDLSAVGAGGVSVSTPAPGGGTSNVVALTITEGTLPPILKSVAPTTTKGSLVFIFTGNYFQATTKGQVNGQDRPTVFISKTQIQVTLQADDMVKGATTRFNAYNPSPDYSISNSYTLIRYYLPLNVN